MFLGILVFVFGIVAFAFGFVPGFWIEHLGFSVSPEGLAVPVGEAIDVAFGSLPLIGKDADLAASEDHVPLTGFTTSIAVRRCAGKTDLLGVCGYLEASVFLFLLFANLTVAVPFGLGSAFLGASLVLPVPSFSVL